MLNLNHHDRPRGILIEFSDEVTPNPQRPRMWAAKPEYCHGLVAGLKENIDPARDSNKICGTVVADLDYKFLANFFPSRLGQDLNGRRCS